MNERDLKYLELLSKNFPNVASTAAEIVRLSAIFELPKTTEHFMSDIHGEYSYFTHILKNASGAIHSKIDDSFGDLLGEDVLDVTRHTSKQDEEAKQRDA